jgi:hypothetical protein
MAWVRALVPRVAWAGVLVLCVARSRASTPRYLQQGRVEARNQ